MKHLRDGDPALAEAEFRRAIEMDYTHHRSMHQLGSLAYKSCRYPEALGWFRRACEIVPDNPVYLTCLGAVHHELGQHDEAIRCHNKALKLDHDNPIALNNLGIVLASQGRHEEARDHFLRALEARHNDAATLCNLGAAHRALGDVESATRCYEGALDIEPTLLQARSNLANLHQSEGRWDEALSLWEGAATQDPTSPSALLHLARTLHQRGRYDEAILKLREALRLAPESAEVHNALAATWLELNRPKEALSHAGKAVKLDPGHTEAHNTLGNVRYAMGDLDQAASAYRRSIETSTEATRPRYNLGLTLQNQGRLLEARPHYEAVIAKDPSDRLAHGTFAASLLYDPEMTIEEICAEHDRWAKAHAPAAPAFAGSRDPDPERPLRVGYVSPDFRSHAVAGFLEGVLRSHDPSRVETYCYAEVAAPDYKTEELRRLAPHWRSTVGMSDREMAMRIEQDRIDILVELSGHTSNNRLPVFALRPAPVQVSYLGYPCTTGLPVIDYRLIDEVLDNPPERDASPEELVTIPGGFCCYTQAEVPIAEGLPEDREGRLTFGSLNKLEKLNDRVLDLWCEVIKSVPGSRLLLCRHTLHGGTAEHIGQRLRDRGLTEEQYSLHRAQAVEKRHLSLYDEIDIALDPFPWTGHTTACEALWMGVPVVTLLGRHAATRMVASVLTMTGLRQWIAKDREEYLRIAVDLAKNKAHRAELRRDLRDRLKASPLCDAQGFTRRLEETYRDLWRRWREKQPKSTRPPKKASRPVLITGCQRSGTTLLNLILSSHPDVTAIDEDAFDAARLHQMLRDPASKPATAFKLPTIAHEVLGLSEMKDLKVIWCLRDPRDVIASMLKLGLTSQEKWGISWANAPAGAEREIRSAMSVLGGIFHPERLNLWLTYQQVLAKPPHDRTHRDGVFASALCWRLKHELLPAYRKMGIDHHALRYEELIKHPDERVRDLLDFLDLPWHDDVLRHHQLHKGIAVGQTDRSRPIDATNTDKWRETLTEADSEIIRSICGEVAQDHGYSLE